METEMTRFIGRTAFVTGGTTGIGFATAEALIAEGARVVVTGQNATRVAEAGQALGNNALALQADVTSLAAMKDALAQASEFFGPLDILFANAGIAKFVPLEFADAAHISDQIDINIKGVINTVQAAIPHLKNPSSVVLNASTIAGRPTAGGAIYGATKAAVVAISKTLAMELAPKGIRVNSVSPGMTLTPIADKLGLTAEQRDGMLDGARAKAPAGRLADPGEIAQAVLFLASDQAAYLYGSDLVVDGGVQFA